MIGVKCQSAMCVKQVERRNRGGRPCDDAVARSGRTAVCTAHAAADVRLGTLLRGHGRFGCLNVGGVMRIIGAAGPVAHAFQLDPLCAHLRTSDGRAGFLSVSNDREGDGGRDDKREMTGYSWQCSFESLRLKRTVGMHCG